MTFDVNRSSCFQISVGKDQFQKCRNDTSSLFDLVRSHNSGNGRNLYNRLPNVLFFSSNFSSKLDATKDEQADHLEIQALFER